MICLRHLKRLARHGRSFCMPQNWNEPLGTSVGRQLSDAKVQRYPDTSIGTSYNSDHQQKILSVLNKSSSDKLRKFNITIAKAAAIVKHRRKYGDYKLLDDVLEVDGFGLTILQKFCDSVVYGLSEDYKHHHALKMQLCFPNLTEETRQKLKSVVAVHINASDVVWVHLNRDFAILEWDSMPLEEKSQTYNHLSSLHTAREIVGRLPVADVYLLEHRRMKTTNRPQTLPMIPGVLQIESMVTVLLSQENGTLVTDKVLTIKNSTVCHYFRLVVGNENTSGQALVESLVTGHHCLDLRKLTIDPISWRLYSGQPSSVKEVLSKILLHAIAFYELEVKRLNETAVKRPDKVT